MIPTYPYWNDILRHAHDDDAHERLAAWLNEQDDPRGEFIHLQCQLKRLDACDPLRFALEGRERELLADHRDEWLGEVADLVDWCVFRRGFPDEISISTSLFIRHADKFAETTIRQVHLTAARDKVGLLATAPVLKQLTYLDLSNNFLRDQGVRLLAESPNVGNLEGLNLSSTGTGDAGACALAASRHLIGLRELYLCDNRNGRNGLRALEHSPLVRQLEVLSLRCNDCDSDGVRLRAADPALSLHM